MALLASPFLWMLTQLALIFAGLLSPDIGIGDIYQTIDLIHGISLLSAVVVLISNLVLLVRVPRPRKTALMFRVNAVGMAIALGCFWALGEVAKSHR